MPTAQKSLIQVELGQSMIDFAAMADSGDHKRFTIAAAPIWSGKSGFEIDLRPNGIKDGVRVVSPHANNDTVQIDGFTAYSQGVEHTVTAQSLALTRPSTQNYKICSVTMDNAGSIAEVGGVEGSSFSATRGDDGGPPLIPTTSVEIGQIRVTAQTAAAVDSDEIYQVVGTHTERSDYPIWDENNIGEGEAADAAAKKNAFVEFQEDLPLIHTGSVTKQIYIKYYTPSFATVARGVDFKPAEESHSVSSVQYYRGTLGSVSSSLGQGGFTAYLQDGITDALVSLKNEVITVKYYQDENESPYILTQGKLGLSRTNPADNPIQAAVTISAESISAEFAS